MANILVAFFNGVQNSKDPAAVPCFYEGFINGLTSAGNDVMAIHHNHFAWDFAKISDKLKEAITSFDPALAIIFNNSFFDLSYDFDFPIIIYEVDSFKYYSNKDSLKANKERYKFAVCQTKSIEVLKHALGVDNQSIEYFPFATAVQNEPLDKTINISFIGNRFPAFDYKGILPWNRFMQSNPSKSKIEMFKKFMADIKAFPQYSKEIIDKYQSSSFNIKSITDKCDILMSLTSQKRESVLAEVADLGLAVFGPRDWVTCNCSNIDLTLSYNPKHVYSLKQNQDIYNQSYLGININHYQAESGFSWRVCDIMASGAVLVSEYCPDFKTLFHDIPIPTFNNRYEARDICKKLLASPYMREDIVGKCNEIIDLKYRFCNIVKKLESLSGVKLNNYDNRKAGKCLYASI